MACLGLHFISYISALWPVWLYNIFPISKHCDLSCSTIYSSYQRTVYYPGSRLYSTYLCTVTCLALQFIPHISTLWTVWLFIIFQISEHWNLSGCTIYLTYQLTMDCLALKYIPYISAPLSACFYNSIHISGHFGLAVYHISHCHTMHTIFWKIF